MIPSSGKVKLGSRSGWCVRQVLFGYHCGYCVQKRDFCRQGKAQGEEGEEPRWSWKGYPSARNNSRWCLRRKINNIWLHLIAWLRTVSSLTLSDIWGAVHDIVRELDKIKNYACDEICHGIIAHRQSIRLNWTGVETTRTSSSIDHFVQHSEHTPFLS